MASLNAYVFSLSADHAAALASELDRLSDATLSPRARGARPSITHTDFYDTPKGALLKNGWLAYARHHSTGIEIGIQRRRSASPGCLELADWRATLSPGPFEPAQFANLAKLPAGPRRLLEQNAPLEPLLHAELQQTQWRIPAFSGHDLDATLLSGHFEIAGERFDHLELTLSSLPTAGAALREQVRQPLLALAQHLHTQAPLWLQGDSAMVSRLQEHFALTATPHKYAGVRLKHRSADWLTLRHANLNGVFAHWLANQYGVKARPDVEYIHQLRLALRRLHTASKIFAPWLDPIWLARLAPELRWLRSLLGQARDWDVFVTATLPALGAATRALPRPAILHEALEQAETLRIEARLAVQAALASPRYAALVLDLAQGLLAQDPAQEAPNPPRKYVRRWLRKNHLSHASDEPFISLPPTQQHRIRLRAKRMRYALEFLGPWLRSGSARAANLSYMAVLDALGDANDAAVAGQLERRLVLDDATRGFVRGWLCARRLECLNRVETHLPHLSAPQLKRARRIKR